MMARIRTTIEKRARGEKGFTLIELLVVVIIIGILAAIAIPAFLKQREKAWGAAVVSDISSAQIAAEAYATDHNGSYAGLTNAVAGAAGLTSLRDNGYNVSTNVVIAVTLSAAVGTTPAGANYTLVGTHNSLPTTKTWTYTSVNGTMTNT